MNVGNKYRDPDSFCKHRIKNPLSIPSQCLFPIKNFDQLYAFLTKLDIDFDFIGITESRNSNTNFSPISIALENDTIKQVPTKSNHTVTDPQATANTFNSFFCLVATEVESEVSFSYKTFFEYLPPLNHESFFISPCTKAELIEIF